MNRKLFFNIVERINSTPYFSDYKIRKRDNRLMKKTAYGCNVIEFQYWSSYDLKRNCMADIVIPQYFVRFDVLDDWFEKYSFKTLIDQRDNCTIGFDGKMLNMISDFYFRTDGVDFEQDFNILKDEVTVCSKMVFEKYSSLEDMYKHVIIPILEGGGEPLPDVGADWVFEYLKLCHIVSPENYEKLKSIVLKRVEFMNNRGEPNISKYYSNLDTILKDMERSTD